MWSSLVLFRTNIRASSFFFCFSPRAPRAFQIVQAGDDFELNLRPAMVRRRPRSRLVRAVAMNPLPLLSASCNFFREPAARIAAGSFLSASLPSEQFRKRGRANQGNILIFYLPLSSSADGHFFDRPRFGSLSCIPRLTRYVPMNGSFVVLRPTTHSVQARVPLPTTTNS